MSDCVSLEEVLAAASARCASLVPETSGYLTLAVADATSQLPLAVDERAVMLTTEGSIALARRGDPVPAAESARQMRALLARLLSASSGSMPSLVAAARARTESAQGVDAVVVELEAALIPVNRNAARRALARLARETLRGRASGKLKRALRAAAAARAARGASEGEAEAEAVAVTASVTAAAPVSVSVSAPAEPPVEVLDLVPTVIDAPVAPKPADALATPAPAAPAPVVSAAEPAEPQAGVLENAPQPDVFTNEFDVGAGPTEAAAAPEDARSPCPIEELLAEPSPAPCAVEISPSTPAPDPDDDGWGCDEADVSVEALLVQHANDEPDVAPADGAGPELAAGDAPIEAIDDEPEAETIELAVAVRTIAAPEPAEPAMAPPELAEPAMAAPAPTDDLGTDTPTKPLRVFATERTPAWAEPERTPLDQTAARVEEHPDDLDDPTVLDVVTVERPADVDETATHEDAIDEPDTIGHTLPWPVGLAMSPPQGDAPSTSAPTEPALDAATADAATPTPGAATPALWSLQRVEIPLAAEPTPPPAPLAPIDAIVRNAAVHPPAARADEIRTAPTTRTRADELIAAFGTGAASEALGRAAARTMKALAGLDLTPPPAPHLAQPRCAEPASNAVSPRDAPPGQDPADEIAPAPPAAPPAAAPRSRKAAPPPRRRGPSVPIALLALALICAGLIVTLRPDLLASLAPPLARGVQQAVGDADPRLPSGGD